MICGTSNNDGSGGKKTLARGGRGKYGEKCAQR